MRSVARTRPQESSITSVDTTSVLPHVNSLGLPHLPPVCPPGSSSGSARGLPESKLRPGRSTSAPRATSASRVRSGLAFDRGSRRAAEEDASAGDDDSDELTWTPVTVSGIATSSQSRSTSIQHESVLKMVGSGPERSRGGLAVNTAISRTQSQHVPHVPLSADASSVTSDASDDGSDLRRSASAAVGSHSRGDSPLARGVLQFLNSESLVSC